MYAANLIAHGVYRIPYNPQPLIDGDESPDATEYAQFVEIQRQMYPSLEIVPADPEWHHLATKYDQRSETATLKKLETTLQTLGIVSKGKRLPSRLISGTLHEALDAYVKSDVEGVNVFPGTDKLTQHGMKREEIVLRLKEHTPDLPLYSLDLEEAKDIVNHWRGRPIAKRSKKPITKETAVKHLKELRRFFRWLDATEKFKWRKPRGFDTIKWTVADDLTEKVPVHKRTYYPEQLATIAAHLDGVGKMALALGLNLAMGAAEVGRLRISDFLLNHEHEYQRKLKFESTKEDSFCRMFRPKNKVFCEMLLWPEVVPWVRWGIDRAKRLKTDVIFCNDKGDPLYVEDAANPQYQFANMWSDVIEKLANEDFPKLPFGSLRDTLPDELQQVYTDEIASLSLAHGKRIGADTLLDCYANRPFGKLHKAIRATRTFFLPVLTEL